MVNTEKESFPSNLGLRSMKGIPDVKLILCETVRSSHKVHPTL
jgi:hypothetical protein